MPARAAILPTVRFLPACEVKLNETVVERQAESGRQNPLRLDILQQIAVGAGAEADLPGSR